MAHKHSVYDTDAHFKIDAITRTIRNDSSGKTVLIQGDHNSERFTFEVPRMVDGHDLSLCNRVQVHYINIDSTDKTKVSKDLHELDDLQVSPDSDDVVICSWQIEGKATKYAGLLNFLLKFKCVSEDGTVDYVWNTAIFTGISISSGIDNGEAIIEDYSDVLEQWRREIDKTNEAIGNLFNLDTEEKSNVVGAINEVHRAEKTNTELSEVWAAISVLQNNALNYPVLKSGATCFKPDTTGMHPVYITEIHFVDSYAPMGNEDATFNLDEGGTGSIKGYRTGTKITVCGNGSGKIRLNPNSANLFGVCWDLAVLTGLELLDASNVTNLSGMFAQCRTLREVDLSSWKVPNLTQMNGMFNACDNLERVIMPQYGIPAGVSTISTFAESHKVKEVDFGRGLTVLTKQTFHRCHSLESVVGLGNVSDIGDFAFVYTPSVKTDLNPKRIKTLGASAFRLSGVEDHADFSSVASVGLNATRNTRWGSDELAAIQAVKMPDVHINVPNPDSIDNYPDIVYCVHEGENLTIDRYGCAAMTLYHIWNVKYAGTDKEYSNFRAWWEGEIDNDPENPWTSTNTMPYHIINMLNRLGWTREQQITQINATEKERIAQLLSAGEPVMVAMISSRPEGTTHTVAVIGSDAKTGKLEVLDSCNYGLPEASPWVSWLSFEDMFTQAFQDDNNADGEDDPPEFIYLIDYNPNV